MYASGYLVKARYEQTLDGDSKTDWFMYYTPGPKARAEYHAFTKRPITISPAADPDAEAGEPPALTGVKHQTATAPVGEPPAAARPVPIEPTVSTPPPEAAAVPELVAALTRRGILETRARKLLEHLAEGQEILDQLEWGDYLIAQAQPGSFRNPPGFYISLIRDNVIPPQTFENSRRRAIREERERAHEQWLFEEQQLRFDYDRYREDEKERYIRENLSEQRYQELFQAKRQQFKRQYPRLPEQTITDMAHGAIRGELEPQITFLTFAEWKNQQPVRRVDPGQGSAVSPAPVSGTPSELPPQTLPTNPVTGT